MRIAEISQALKSGARVRLAWGHPHDHSDTRAEGRVIGYSETPMVLVETDAGEQVWWGIELAYPAVSLEWTACDGRPCRFCTAPATPPARQCHNDAPHDPHYYQAGTRSDSPGPIETVGYVCGGVRL